MIKMTESNIASDYQNIKNPKSATNQQSQLSLIKSDLESMKSQLKEITQSKMSSETVEGLEINLLKLKVTISSKIKALKKLDRIKQDTVECITQGEATLKELSSEYESSIQELYCKCRLFISAF